MKGVAVFIMFCVLLSSSARATGAGLRDNWLFAGEAFVGAGLGGCLLLLAAQSDEYKDRLDWPAAAGWAVGNAGGVILIGELVDAKSRNWYVTYPATLVGASIIPVTAGVIADHKDLEGDGAFYAALAIFFGTPFVTAFTYNIVKDPVPETSEARGAVGFQPYAALLPDNGDGYVPVYGIAASF